MRAVVILGIALAACGIDPRSDDFRCGPGMGVCATGRVCADGWCVADTGEVDASTIDSPACPAACSRCTGSTCIIECDAAGECDARVICPADFDCDVRCIFDGSCTAGVQCGTGRCTISCSGAGSCAGDLTCSNACACVTTCAGAGACSGNTSCPGPGLCTVDGNCTDGPGQCDRC